MGRRAEEQVTVFLNRVFAPTHSTRCRYVALMGSAGSGKSTDTAMFYILRLTAEKGRNLLCVRKVEDSHRHSTFAELCAALERTGLSRFWEVRPSEPELICQNGSRILFRGMYDARQREKIKSISLPQGKLTDIWVEEATELTEEDLEQLDDRLRGRLPEGLFYQIRLTFNPVSASHWIKRRFFDVADPDVCTCRSTYRDNRFLDEGFALRMEKLRRRDPERWRVYGNGEWGVTEGQILQRFSVRPFDPTAFGKEEKALGQDFGFNHPNAIVEVALRDGVLYVLRELICREKTTEEIIAAAKAAGFPTDLPLYCDAAEPDRILQWRRAGFAAAAARKGAGSVRQQIDWLQGHDIVLHESCTHLLSELQGWCWERSPVTGQFTDVPVPVRDDAIAALRYATERWRKAGTLRTLSRRALGL